MSSEAPDQSESLEQKVARKDKHGKTKKFLVKKRKSFDASGKPVDWKEKAKQRRGSGSERKLKKSPSTDTADGDNPYERTNKSDEDSSLYSESIYDTDSVMTEDLRPEGIYNMDLEKLKSKPFMTAQMLHALKMSQTQSRFEYQQEMKKLQGKYNLDACLSDLPEVEAAKKASQLASKSIYKKNLEEVQSKYKGFQQLPFEHNADVQRSVKASQLSDKKYKEDWEYDKSYVCFPATLTPNYETMTSAQRNASDTIYKAGNSRTLQNVHFDPTQTDFYKRIQDNLKIRSDKEYRAAYERNKALGFTSVGLSADMERYKSLRSIANPHSYSSDARKLWGKYNLVMPVPLIAQAIQTAKVTSDNQYKADFKKEIVGKTGRAGIISYPELKQAKKAVRFASTVEYSKDAEKAKTSYTISPYAPEFLRAKTVAGMSDKKYKEQKEKTIANFQGYQRMDPQQHPVVQRAKATAVDEKAYKEDWEYEKQNIYYPVHITPGYEATSDVKRATSDAQYKKEYEIAKAQNKYDVTSTRRYAELKEAENVKSDTKYTEEYNKNKANVTPVPETHEMALSKKMQPVLSKKLYGEKSKEYLATASVGPDGQEISHAVEKQKQSSSNTYRQEYKTEMVGHPPYDPASAYPEHDLHRKMTKLVSKPGYTKDAEVMRQVNQLPVDSPEFLRAKKVAFIASDVEYKKQKKEAIDQYRGFQTMDSKEHPVVQQAAKAASLTSEASYKEDWEYDKQNIYYPVHITPGYETSSNVKKVQSDATYKQEFEKKKMQNQFRLTETDRYLELKQLENARSDVKYKEGYEKGKGKSHTQVPETPEMALSKELRPVQSKKLYSEQSKEMQKTVNIGTDTQEVAHAVSAQRSASPNPYRKQYKEEIVGKGPVDPAIGYPEHDQHKKASVLASKAGYSKEAEELMHHHKLPVDAPEFVRARESAKISSDIEYQKQRQEVIDKYRGFQTMDSHDHPIVQQGIKAAELINEATYKEGWEYDKQMIYFPAHITPGYEASSDVKKVQSDTSYKEGYKKSKDKNKYVVTDTEGYKNIKEGEKASGVRYKKEYEKNKGRNHTDIPETPEMTLSKGLRPVQSKKLYAEKSKEMQKNVNVGTDVQEVAHAVYAQHISSPHPYKKQYKEDIVGKGPVDPAIGYPEHEQHKKATELVNKAGYTKEAEELMHHNKLPADAPEFIRAKESAKIASNVEYQKQRQEVIDQYRGFQTMDSHDHPIVQQGIKAAELNDAVSYKEDWEYDKQMIYFPAHITPGYEASSDVKKVQSDATYKEGYNKSKEKNTFVVTETEAYKSIKDGEKTSRVKYTEEYEKNKGRNHTEIPETPEMTLSKELRPVQSKKLYAEKSKKMQKNVKVGTDVQELAHAVSAQRIASPNPYRKQYKEEIVGKGPIDPAIGYPEHEQHKKATDLSSKAGYSKEAEELMHHHKLPVDAPEFIRAKESAKIASDIEYQKQRQEVIDKYRGFQTMDSHDHPIVQQGIKAAELASNALYKEDWEYDKQMIYFPAHITPGYEASSDVKKVQSDKTYKEDYEKMKDRNTYTVTETEEYKTMKEGDKSSGKRYTEEYEANKGRNHTEIAETPEMVLSKGLRPVLSKKLYTEKSKRMQKNVTVGSDVQEIEHAVNSQKISSDQRYTAEYKKVVLGKGRSDPEHSYPEVQLHRNAHKIRSRAEYHKEAEKMMHTHNLPLDYPEFVRARETAKNASDAEYRKQRQEVIDKYRGFQTMDSHDHPIVQQGIKAAELASNALYKEDWEYDKQMIYFPAHITPGYEASADVKKVQSDATYKENFEKMKDKNRYVLTDTERYKSMKENDQLFSDKKYKEEYEANKGRSHTEIPETPEMILSKELRPALSKKLYTEKSKEMQKNVTVGRDVQEIAHAVSAQEIASGKKYKSEYEATMVGLGPKDPAKSYPEYDRLREVNKIVSVPLYHKDAEAIMHHHNLPLDYPEFVRAKEAAKNASDREYQKQRQEVIDKYRGFQTMDSHDHPIVQQGIKAAELASNTAYTEDWEYDKQNIYFPAHITPGYEASSDVKKVQSDVIYKEHFEKTKDKNQFVVTDTERYKSIKETDQISEVKYKEEYEKNKGRNHTEIAETHEMTLSKELRPVQSKKLYSEQSKEMQKNVAVGADVQEISHAVTTQKLSSGQVYKADYEKNMLGKAPADIAKSYPEYNHLRNVSKQSSNAEYVREAEKMMHHHNLPLDYPEFVRARESAKNASDMEYQKQKKEVIDKYRGFQTMDSHDHPIVQQGIKAAELASNALYKEDWEYDKQMIYFPAHITPGYEASADVKKVQSNVTYKETYEKQKDKNKFIVTETENYKNIKEGEKSLAVRYKEEYEKNKGRNHTEIPVTPEMILSKELRPVQSKKLYTEKSKEMRKDVKVGKDVQEIAHALSTQKLTSSKEYHAEYDGEMVGKAPADQAKAYPEYDLLKKVSKQNSKALYVKEAEKMMHHHNLPLDYPEFIRARESAKNASDSEYRKQRKQVIDSYRGFQTMDSKEHPVVQQGIKAAELASTSLYIEDWEYDKHMIYYPVHITPGYEQATKASKFQSQVEYSKDGLIAQQKNQFLETETERYQAAKNLLQLLSGTKYHEKYLQERGKSLHGIAETPEMLISKSLKPLLSTSTYSEKAKKTMQKYNLDTSTQDISHALDTQKLFSKRNYVKDFRENVVGKAPADLAKSYPEYDLARQNTSMASKSEYVKEADKTMHQHNLPLDYPEFVRAKENAKNASDAEYRKQRKEVIDKYRGFQTMDSHDHPIVQQGIKAAELASNKSYTEDWEYDKSMIYFPAHITPGYEASTESTKAISDAVYKKDFKENKSKNKFNVADTEHYKFSRQLTDIFSDKKYHKEYEATKGTNRIQMKETPEMKISKSLRPLLSNKLYGEEARRKMQEYNLDASMQGIAQALSVQRRTDLHPYTDQFRKTIKGKGPSDPANSYPEYNHAKEVSKLTSKALYVVEAEKLKHTHNLPLDYPEFVRAKSNAKNASDAEYRKQRKEVIDSYRGFQTMDSKDHPVVQRGIKAAELISEKKYKEDYMDEKDMIYFPVHITPGYETALKSSEMQSNVNYKKDAIGQKQNKYSYTETEMYRQQKDLHRLRDHVYKDIDQPFSAIERTPEMDLSNLVKSILSDTAYKKAAKKRMDVYNIDLQDQKLAHVMYASKLSSDPLYKLEFKNEVWGKAPSDLAISHPEYEHAKQVSQMISKAQYVKEAEKMMHHHNLPLDYPEFIRARETAKNASDMEYQKQRKEVIDSYRGFQTMDSKDHPVVQQGIKAAELISNAAYKEDWEYDKQMIYFPAHITPGYEASSGVKKVQSDVAYKEKFEKGKDKNRFNIMDTERYKSIKEMDKSYSEKSYREPGRKMMETEFSPVSQTREMIRAGALKPFNASVYQQRAKDLMHKYHLNVELPEITHAVLVNQMASKNNYIRDYNEKLKGAAPADLANSYPEYDHARNVSKITSNAEYTKTGEAVRHQFSLPVDTPELNRAKEAAKNASDLLYKKQRKEVIDSYRGFQTMDSKEHPVVQQGIKAAELISERKYKEDYMDDRDLIYYPVHITPGYEAAVKSSELQSDFNYKSKHKKEKQKNTYNAVLSEQYEANKLLHSIQTHYKQDLQKLPTDLTFIMDSVGLTHAKSMKDLMSGKLYTYNAKKSLDKYNLNTDVVQIAHALLTTPLISSNSYKKAYLAEQKGKGISGSGLDFYLDYVKAKENTKLSSKSQYVKENEKVIHHYCMPADTPELIRAKESAINSSDLHYTKQRKEVIENYRGFQTMDSKDHPIVQRGIKSAELISERKYKEDYMEDRNLIYYPVHLTPGYESATKASQYINGPNYKKAYIKNRNDFLFDPTKTDQYSTIQELNKLSDNVYKQDPSLIPYTQVDDSPDLARAKAVKPLLSYYFYKDQAKKMLDKYHIDVADQKVVHALHSNQLYSDNLYKEEYLKEVRGKLTTGNIEAFPQLQHAIKTGKQGSQCEYTKKAANERNKYTIPADMPSIVQAKTANEQFSEHKYGKSKRDTIDQYRGFQTMDSKGHPVVQQGIKAAELISERKYKEDYMTERGMIYFPVHLTPGYEAAIKAVKFSSDADYKRWYMKNIRGGGNYQVHLSPGYKQAQEILPFISDNLYKKKGDEMKSQFSVVPDSTEMRSLKIVQPWLSKSKYKKAALELMGKYHLDAEVPEIAHALYITNLSSAPKYREEYEKEVKGFGAKGLDKSPYMQQLLKSSKLTSKANYGRKAEEELQHYKLDIETNEIQQAMAADRLTSKVSYKKGGDEAIANCHGYFKLNASDIPSYKKHRSVAQNISDTKYREEYNDMKKYVYFPYHITPQYEKQAAADKYKNQHTYMKDYEDNKWKQNFKFHEIPAYVSNKELQELLNVHRLKKDLENLHTHGFKSSPDDFSSEHMKEVQKRVSNNIYKAAAKEVMDKYNITAELPEIKQALVANKLVSENAYKEDLTKQKGHAMKYDPKIPAFQHKRAVKGFSSDKLYKDAAIQALRQYLVIADPPDLQHAKTVKLNTSMVEYKKAGKEKLANVRGYQLLKADEQRDVAHARKVNDLISPAKYKEEYNELRNIIYFPVHLTSGYESALQANKFASPANYKKQWLENRFKNSFKVHETEGYQLDQAVQKIISNIGYKAAYNKTLGKCPYISETPQRAHHRQMKDLASDTKYKHGAVEIMDKYNLITDEPRLVNALRVMKQISDNVYKEEYEKEKGKLFSDLKDTPQMKHALKVSKLASEIPYKQQAVEGLQYYTIPEDSTFIKHAQKAGELTSEISYKKDAKDNRLQGYNRLPAKDNYVLRHLEGIKDLQSESIYKRDYFDQKGQLIPVADTPENVRLLKQQKLQSDNVYRKDLEKHIKGHGLTTDQTPLIQHAKDMRTLHSETKYREGIKDQHDWKSGEAINTPTAIKAKEAYDMQSDFIYKQEYEDSKGQGCNVVTPFIEHVKETSKAVSENTYKEKHKEDSKYPPAFCAMPTTPHMQHAQEIGNKINARKYREEHDKEDIGLPTELKDSVQIMRDRLTTQLQSSIEYKKQGKKESALHSEYFACLNDTPQAKHAQKVKDILSDYKYKEVYENEKGIVYYPYFLTPMYETQTKAGKLQSQVNYTKKAGDELHLFHLSTDQPNFKQALRASEIFSDLKYRQPYQGKGAKIKEPRDVPSVLHSKKMQELLSDKRYRSNYEKIKDKYHLDAATPTFIQARKAAKLLSDRTYKRQHMEEIGKPYDSFKDSLQMKHLRSLPEKFSDNMYKQDLIVSKGKVIQVADTPWLQSHKRAQNFISHIKYGQQSGKKLKCLYQPDKFNKHVKKVTNSISDITYHDDYENYYKGNLIPLPVSPQSEKTKQLKSQAAYKQKAKEDLQKYLFIPDDPEYKRLKEVASFLSNITYKEDAAKQQNEFTSIPDAPLMTKAKETQELQSENAYKDKAKKSLATDFRLPAEGTATMQQQQFATELASENYYKGKGERIKHDPVAYKQLKETRDIKHAKKMSVAFSQLKYREEAKKTLPKIHPVTEDPWLQKAKETYKNISDIAYKAKDKDLHQKFKLGKDDSFIKHAISVRNKISDVKYKEDYIENVGLCWCLPDEKVFQHARKVADLFSDTKYKKEARKLKGKYHVTTDTPEYERLRKVQEDISETKYKEDVLKMLKDYTILESTPEIKHATDVSGWVSQIKYKEDAIKLRDKFTVLEKDPKVEHAQNVNKHFSNNAYQKKHKEMQKKGFTFIPDTEQLKRAQKNASSFAYKRDAKDKVDKEFTVLEKMREVEHAVNTAKMQSEVQYKQKLDGKDIDTMATPSMKHVIGANKLQSDLEYRKDFDEKIKGKGWQFTKDTPAQKHAEEIGSVQSQYKYTKKHRENVGKGFTTIADRPDIMHATSCKEVVSDYEYKRRHRDMAGKGYTFTPDNPSQLHAEEITNTQSELQYRRKFGNKGKSWVFEDSPTMGHSIEAQKLVGNIDYKKSAKEINSRGTSAAMEHTPTSLQNKKAQEILNDRKYKADYEKNVKGRGMTFDLHGTPTMDYIKRAEDIKSDKLYKEHYESSMKGKASSAMVNAPQLVQAQHANKLISDVQYKQNYRENVGRSHSLINTPEMIRVKENQKAVSQIQYKADAEQMKGRQTALLDTPELRMVRQNTQNFSSLKYKDSTVRGTGVAIVDTPELRMAKQNAKNFSQIKYKEDGASYISKPTQVVDDLTMKRVKQATMISSDVAYKGMKNKTKEMDMKRAFAVNLQKDKSITKQKLPGGPVMPPEAKHKIVRAEPMKRWRRNPGSIFDYDPSDYKSDAEYEQGKPLSAGLDAAESKARESFHSDVDGYDALKSYDPKAARSQAVSWTDYVIGMEGGYKHVGAPCSVQDYNSSKAHHANVEKAEKKQYKAVYDYVAADVDEITFSDGDIITNAQPIDEGWMFGTCLRTGKTGMLPSNYVQLQA